MTVQNITTRGTLYVLVAATLWGLSGVFAQFLFQQRHVSPEWLVSIRLILPGLLLLGVGWLKKQKKIFDVWRYNAPQMLIYAIFGMLAVQLTFFITIKYSNAATATVLQFVNPVIVAVAVSIQIRKMPPLLILISAAFALGGTFLLATHGSFKSLNISPEALFWGIASAFAAAFYTLYSINLIKRYGAVTIVGWAMFTGGMAVSLFYPPWNITGVWDFYTWLGALYIIFLGSLVTFYLFLAGVQLIGGEKASVLGCAEPLAAAIFSVIFLNVKFGFMDWMGSLFIVAAVLMQSRAKPRG